MVAHAYFGRCFILDVVTPSVSLCPHLARRANAKSSPRQCLPSPFLQFIRAIVKMKISNNPTTAAVNRKKKHHHHHHLHPLVHLHPLLKCHPTKFSSLMSLSSQPVPKPFPAPPLQLLQWNLLPSCWQLNKRDFHRSTHPKARRGRVNMLGERCVWAWARNYYDRILFSVAIYTSWLVGLWHRVLILGQ